MTELTANKPHYPALDGLRGLAILLVVLYHNFSFINYSIFGWIGVDLFFVLSGYLITSILLKAINSPNYLKNFYVRRLLRIFPLYYTFLIIFLIIFPQIPSLKSALSYYTNNQFWLWLYLQNWLYVFKEPQHAEMLNHLWSLAVEEQFYLIWPCLILLIRKPKILFVFVAFLLLLVMATRFIIWTLKIEHLSYFSLYTFTRIDGICIGCMLALLRQINISFLNKNTAVVVFTLAGMNFLFYFFNSFYHFTFPYLAIVGYTTFAVMFGLLVNEAVTKQTPIINKIFGTRILVFFGKISYGFYMFHWPIYLIVTPYIHEFLQSAINVQSSLFKILSALSATILALLVSIISFRYFESYFLSLKKKFI
jgi:peptidoglycan/LPS O-acetylase OafA/YrhL